MCGLRDRQRKQEDDEHHREYKDVTMVAVPPDHAAILPLLYS